MRVEKKKARNFFFFQFPIQLKFLHLKLCQPGFPSHRLSPDLNVLCRSVLWDEKNGKRVTRAVSEDTAAEHQLSGLRHDHFRVRCAWLTSN